MLMTRMNMHRGMVALVERQESNQLETLVPELSELYQQNGNWNFLRNSPRRWNRLLRLTRPENAKDLPGKPGPEGPGREGPGHGEKRMHEGPGGRRPPSREHANLRARLFLLDENKSYVAGAVLQGPAPPRLEAIQVDENLVGWVGFIPVQETLPPEARSFLRRQTQTLLVSLLVALTLAAGLGFMLARHLSRPVRQLADAVEALNRGDYGARAPISTRDEIGDLGRDVNSLAETLESNRTARRRWMADIAHELRTPVSVLKGEIEALEDGVRPFDVTAAVSLREETEQLSRLVGDLQTLALSDAGALDFRMEAVDLSELLLQLVLIFEGRMKERGLVLKVKISQAVWIEGDAQRLRQLLHNLLENTCRYVESGGQVLLALCQQDGKTLLSIDDSGPGLQEQEMTRLFERFFRVEGSRARTSGGSGLGLSICRNIAEAHQGSIQAVSSDLGGLRIEVILPGH